MVMLWKAVKWFKQKFVTSEDPVISCNINNRGELTNINDTDSIISNDDNSDIYEEHNHVIFESVEESANPNEYSLDINDVSNSEHELMSVQFPESIKWIQDIIDKEVCNDDIYELHCYGSVLYDILHDISDVNDSELINFDEYAYMRLGFKFDTYHIYSKLKTKMCDKIYMINYLHRDNDTSFSAYVGTLYQLRKLCLNNIVKLSSPNVKLCLRKHKQSDILFSKNITLIMDDDTHCMNVINETDIELNTGFAHEPDFIIHDDTLYSIVYQTKDSNLHIKRDISFSDLQEFINNKRIFENYIILCRNRHRDDFCQILAYKGMYIKNLNLEKDDLYE